MVSLTTAWRGEVTPDGERLVPVTPGHADRMLYLLQQIAGTDQLTALGIGAAP
jgi:hypothetical protein